MSMAMQWLNQNAPAIQAVTAVTLWEPAFLDAEGSRAS